MNTVDRLQSILDDTVDKVMSIQRCLLQEALNALFFDNQYCQHLVSPENIDAFIDLINNPIEYPDCYLLDWGKLDPVIAKIRQEIKTNIDHL